MHSYALLEHRLHWSYGPALVRRRAVLRALVAGGVALVVVAGTGCGGGGESADDVAPSGTVVERTSTTEGPTTTSTTEAATTPTSHAPDTVEGQVEAAYLHSWEVTTEAFAEVDSAPLAEAFADTALQYRTQDVEGLEADGQAVEVDVEHAYRISLDSSTRAVVNDIYINHMRLIDPATGDYLEPDPNEQVGSSYLLELRDGTWIVIDINRI
jgi:hypothetical protein